MFHQINCLPQMSSLNSIQLDHNYNECPEPEVVFEDFDSIEDVVEEVIDVDDSEADTRPANEDLPDLMLCSDDITDYNLLYLQVLDIYNNSSQEDLISIAEAMGLDQTIALNIFNDNWSASDSQSFDSGFNSSSSSSASSSQNNCWNQLSKNNSKKNKRKSSKKAVPKSGKQLRYLYRSLGKSVTKSENSKNEIMNDLMANMTRLRTRSQTKRCAEEANNCADNMSKTVTQNHVNDKNGRKVTTIITRNDSNEEVATVSYDNNIDSTVVSNLCKYFEQIRSNRKASEPKPTVPYTHFLPMVRVEKLSIKARNKSKSPKGLKKSANSLLKENYIPVADIPPTRQGLRSSPRRTGSQLRPKRMVVRNVCDNKCVVCARTKPKTLPQLMSSYLKGVFRRPKQKLKSPIRISLSEKWCKGLTISFEDVLILSQ